MKYFYRFRNIDNLIGTRNELMDQYIYFAESDELNDCMEGYAKYFWIGDHIVWSNLFKHYLTCLDNLVELYQVSENFNLKNHHMRIFTNINEFTNDNKKIRMNKIYNNFFITCNMKKLIDKLDEYEFKLYQNELELILRFIHPIAINSISEVDHPSNLIVNTKAHAEKLFDDDIEHILNLFKSENKLDRTVYDSVLFRAINRSISNSKKLSDNLTFIVADYPTNYLKEIEYLTHERWHIACFMTDVKNPLIWGHYGDGNKGACLIFQSDESNADGIAVNTFKLKNRDEENNNYIEVPFTEVTYCNEFDEISFFSSLGRLNKRQANINWFTTENGEKSKTGEWLNSIDSKWKNDYNKKCFYTITKKTESWNYENEYRLVITDFYAESLDNIEYKKLEYQFSNLHGIIFGINTPSKAKMQIVSIIKEKCRINNRTDFKFYQAYFNHDTNEINYFTL